MSLRDKLVTANTKKTNPAYKEISNRIKELMKEKKELETIHNAFYVSKQTPKMKLGELQKLKTDMITIQEKLERERKKLRELSSEKNSVVQEWELETPKEVRAGAVDDVCSAYKSGMSNLKAGNIRHFRLGFRKRKSNYKSVVIPKNFLKNKSGIIHLAPMFFNDDCKFKMGKKTKKKHGDLVINHDCRISKKMDEYWLLVPLPMVCQEKKLPVNYCGVDPGVRTFMTSFGNNGCMEYEYNTRMIQKLDTKLAKCKDKKYNKPNRIYKSKLVKLERRKENLINELHWKTINHLVTHNDFIFYGDIKSHDIVKDGKNRTLNRGMNNLKFYKFKERLLHKAKEHGKNVIMVHEANTTKTCSFCGQMNNVGTSKVYSCSSCNRKVGRDVNAAKNILMKGIIVNMQ